MKRIAALLVVSAAILLSATPTCGQATIALAGGANLASLAIDGSVDPSSPRRIMRLSVGLDATIPLSERLGVQLGGSYSEKGASFRDRGLVDYRGALELGYLELRMLAKALVYDSGAGVELHLLAGPAVARQTSCHRAGQVTRMERTTGHRIACDVDETSSFDFGAVGGAWMEMWIGDRLGLLLNLLHTRGIHDIDAWSDDATMKNRTLSFNTGIVLSIN